MEEGEVKISRHFMMVQNNNPTRKKLSDYLQLSWRKKVDGYFFRAETFWDIINKLEQMSQEPGGSDAFASYGGDNLHTMFHGEAFLAFFKNRVGRGGIYILDEPEAALSPQRQLALLSIIHELCKDKGTQFVIASHSPILITYPGAVIYCCNNNELTPIKYEDTDQYKITKQFLEKPERYFRHLFV